MDAGPPHNDGLLSIEEHDWLEQVLTERSEGAYGAPALQGMLTASTIGPKRLPIDSILEYVLTPPESISTGYDRFPEFDEFARKMTEWYLRIIEVFEEEPGAFRLLVHMPGLKEGDTTPDPRTWCIGFIEGMARQQKDWQRLLSAAGGHEMILPIYLTADPDEFPDFPNPFTALSPTERCETIKLAVLAIHGFWRDAAHGPRPLRASRKPGRNDACPCGSGKKYKHCCGR